MPRIVIVGAGAAGLAVAKTLATTLTPNDNTEVVVLEKSEFYYFPIGTPRAYVDASFAKKLFIPYVNAIPEAARSFVKIVRAVVTAISPQQVVYHTIGASNAPEGDAIALAFDYLVIATGSSYSTPIKQDGNVNARAHTEAELATVRQAIEKASKILVVGGGAVGCEVAGEIAAKYPTKHVTIVEAGPKLVGGNNVRDKFRDKLMNSMRELDVEVVLNERLTTRLSGNVFETRTLTTSAGREIESDVQLLCGGFHPATELVAAMDASLVTDLGFIKVNMQLQLDDARYGHIFALGDACSHPTPKLGFVAGQQGAFLATELVSVVRKTQATFAKEFAKIETEAMLLPLGPNGGVSQLPFWGGLVFGNFLTRMIKSQDYFVGKAWSGLNAAIPTD